MRVRVELRRREGRFIARFRPQDGFTGRLSMGRKNLEDRSISFLTIYVEPKQGWPDDHIPGPELFEARVTDVTGDQIRFMGFEVVDLCWHVQEWDCFVLRNQ